jgi:hypothetical protein
MSKNAPEDEAISLFAGLLANPDVRLSLHRESGVRYPSTSSNIEIGSPTAMVQIILFSKNNRITNILNPTEIHPATGPYHDLYTMTIILPRLAQKLDSNVKIMNDLKDHGISTGPYSQVLCHGGNFVLPNKIYNSYFS